MNGEEEESCEGRMRPVSALLAFAPHGTMSATGTAPGPVEICKRPVTSNERLRSIDRHAIDCSFQTWSQFHAIQQQARHDRPHSRLLGDAAELGEMDHAL